MRDVNQSENLRVLLGGAYTLLSGTQYFRRLICSANIQEAFRVIEGGGASGVDFGVKSKIENQYLPTQSCFAL